MPSVQDRQSTACHSVVGEALCAMAALATVFKQVQDWLDVPRVECQSITISAWEVKGQANELSA